MAGYPGATVTWLAVSAVLAGFVALEISENVPLAPTVTAAPAETADAAPLDIALLMVSPLSPDMVDDIIDRPLFSTSRRPFEPMIDDQPTAMSGPDQRLSLQLVGTMLSSSSRMVLLKHPAEGLVRLRQGQVVEGWKIGEIGNNEVELRRDDEVEWLRLRADLLLPNSDDRTMPKRSGGETSALEKAAAANAKKTSDAAKPKKE